MAMTSNDSELVALVAGGDISAYGELYRRHRAAARRQAQRLASNRYDAEDLVSQAFVAVLDAIQRGSRPAAFRAYLLVAVYTAACNLTIQRRRYRAASTEVLQDTPSRDPDPTTRFEYEPIHAAFRSLLPRWRLALWLSAVEGRPPRELGSLLDLNANGAAALTVRARRGLRRALTTQRCA